jgi:acyl-CoA hydrolase
MNQIVLPQHTNAYGTAFGGTIVSWVDICAAMSAQRHARSVVVTASMDQLHFVAPIKMGELVCLRAMVNFVGKTSMEVGVRVEAEDVTGGRRFHAVSAYLTFVALDADGKKQRVPALEPRSAEEKRRWRQAEARRRLRLAAAGSKSRRR